MKTRFIHIIVFFCSCFAVHFSPAQGRDELRTKLQKLKAGSEADTNRVRLLNDIAWDYSYLNYDSAKYFARCATDLSRKLKFEDGQAEAMNISGNCSRMLQQFDSAFYYFNQSLAIRQKQHNKKKIAGTLQNMANVYNSQRKYPEAIVKYKEALKYAEEANYAEAQLVILSNMTGVYQLVGENQRALDYGMRSLEINKVLKDTLQYGYLYSNIALILQQQNQVDQAIIYNKKALEAIKNINDMSVTASINMNLGSLYKLSNPRESQRYLLTALDLFTRLGDTAGIGMSNQNLGETLRLNGKYHESQEYFNKALKIFETLEDTRLISSANFSIADVLNQMGKYKEALLFVNKGLSYAKIDDDGVRMKNGYLTLSDIYKSMGDYKNAYYYLTRSFQLADTVFNKEIADKNGFLQAELDVTAKENEIELLNKNNELKQTELSKQAVLRNFLIGIVLFVLVFLYFVFAAYRNKKKDNAIILSQKHEVEMKNEIIEHQKKEVDEAYEALHEKNKEVMDSIHYAKRIQRALITSEKYIERNLNELNRKKKS